MIESFLYETWIGGQILYWFFLKHQTQIYTIRYWEAFHLRLGRDFVKEQVAVQT